MTLRDLCLIALCAVEFVCFLQYCLEISQGTFHPLSPDYRFAGTLHPNAQAPNCAIMALSAAFLARHAKRGRLLLWSLCLIGIVTLLLTKSRTVCGALLVSVLIYKSLGQPLGKKALVTVVLLWVASTAALAATLVDWNFEDQAVNVALIGRQDEAESLSGRIPLWTELLPYISEHPIVGHGYMTFWTPQRISTFTHNLEWTVPDGHCAYLDMLLELGVVGISICADTSCKLCRVAASDFRGRGLRLRIFLYRAGVPGLERLPGVGVCRPDNLCRVHRRVWAFPFGAGRSAKSRPRNGRSAHVKTIVSDSFVGLPSHLSRAYTTIAAAPITGQLGAHVFTSRRRCVDGHHD